MAGNRGGGCKLELLVEQNFTKIDISTHGKTNRYFMRCKHCEASAAPIEHRDNRCIIHLAKIEKCPNAPRDVRRAANIRLMQKVNIEVPSEEFQIVQPGSSSMPVILDDDDSDDSSAPSLHKKAKGSEDSAAVVTTVSLKRKAIDGSIVTYMDRPMSEEDTKKANLLLLQHLVYSGSPFTRPECPFFLDFTTTLRPSYHCPTRYTLMNQYLPAEDARVHTLEVMQVKGQKYLTLLTDGWEDRLKRSVYGSMLAEIARHPTVLGLRDLTGERNTADNVLLTVELALTKKEIDPRQIIAVCTDNPTTMQAMRQKYAEKNPWVITLPCFMHAINMTIGKVTVHPVMKATVSKNSHIVTFFRSSHYWGGQLKMSAKAHGINRGLKTNTESRFYALILQAQSVKEYRQVLTEICCCEDATRSVNGLTPITRAVVDIICDYRHWALNDQLIRVCKPLVDVIGNTESHDATLADCMLELIGAHRAIMALPTEPDDNTEFASHARSALLRQFHVMNTDLHWFALLLHPLCCRLAISSALHSRLIEAAYKIGINLASKWNWPEASARQLIRDIKMYYDGEALFTGGIPNAKDWWSSSSISAARHPLKAMALKIFCIVPHAADIERLFSNLAGIQSVKQSTLTIDHMETLGMLRAHYIRILQERAATAGKSVRHVHGHMHTREGGGINAELANDLNTTFTWTAPAAGLELDGVSDRIPQPEDITEADIEQEFASLEKLISTSSDSGDGLAPSVAVADIYSLEELARIERGQIPPSLADETDCHADGAVHTWDPKKVLLELGV